MKTGERAILLLAGAAMLVVASCSSNTITNSNDIIFPASGVSYHHDVQPLFDLSCSYSGCHDQYSKAGGLSLYSYSDLISRAGVVVPEDSTRSVLRQVVRGLLPHSYPISEITNENQRRGVAIWIQEGAHDN